MDMNEGVGLVELAPELIHKIALSGWLTYDDVLALAETCRRMEDILVHDNYGQDIHLAMLGVIYNARNMWWTSARYAMRRKWFAEGEDEASLWRLLARLAVAFDSVRIVEYDDDFKSWEKLLLEALSLPEATGWEEMWSYRDTRGEEGTRLFHVAVMLGSEKVVDWVMERGGDLEGRDSNGNTPLWNACAYGRLWMVKKLVECGADLTAKGGFYRSVLGAACGEGHVDIVEYLLDLEVFDLVEEGAGDDDMDPVSALNAAIMSEEVEVVELLIKRGVDLYVEEWNGFGPLGSACAGRCPAIVRLLIDAGVGSGVAKNNGMWFNGMFEAMHNGRADIVQVLLDAGVDVNSLGVFEDTALCWAVHRCSSDGCVDVVRVLVGEGGADVNEVGKMGRTPLIWACATGKEDVVRVLLEAGADVGVRDDEGETALDVARREGRDGVVRMLEEWGGGE